MRFNEHHFARRHSKCTVVSLIFYAQAFEFFRQVKRVQIDNDGGWLLFRDLSNAHRNNFSSRFSQYDSLSWWCFILVPFKHLETYFCKKAAAIFLLEKNNKLWDCKNLNASFYLVKILKITKQKLPVFCFFECDDKNDSKCSAENPLEDYFSKSVLYITFKCAVSTF